MNTRCGTREPCDWWNTVSLGFVVVLAFLLIWFTEFSAIRHDSNKKINVTAPATSSEAGTAGSSDPGAADEGVVEEEENSHDYE